MSSTMPPQHQDTQPGIEADMEPLPRYTADWYRGSGKLAGRRALITGGDSGIGRAVAILFAREGADVAIAYLDEHFDAHETRRAVEAEGRSCFLFPGDLGDLDHVKALVADTVEALGGLDILVNNAAEQHVEEDFVTREALPHLANGSTIINTTSVVSFTRSLAEQLADRGIRVNGVAPGPIWTPLIPASFDDEQVARFGGDTPLGRPGQPEEVSPAYVYLAARDSSYVTGQVIHVNGGEVVGG